MQNYLIVAVGSAAGGLLRYWLSGAVHNFLPANFPYGTLVVNVIGSFALGIIMFYFDANELISPEWRLMLTVGLCGGLTTFSTFSYETFTLLRESEYLFAGLNIALNLFVTITVVALSFFITKTLNGS